MNTFPEEVPESPPKSSAMNLVSIERVVAFVLGPAIVAGAGWLSTFLAREIGVSISAESMVVVFGAGAFGAAALVYKWLHGRQVEMQVNGLQAGVQAGLTDLEGLAAGQVQVGPSAAPSQVPSQAEIPAAVSDPAPTSAAEPEAAEPAP